MGRRWIKRWHVVSATSGRKDVDQKETGSSTDPKRHSNESRDRKTKEKGELAQLRVLEEEMKDRERVPRVQKKQTSHRYTRTVAGAPTCTASPRRGWMTKPRLSPSFSEGYPQIRNFRSPDKSFVLSPASSWQQQHPPHLFSTTTTTYFTYLYILLSGTGIFVSVIALVLVPYSF